MKFVVNFLIINSLLSLFFLTSAQDLSSADSLFAKGQFTSAQKAYEKVLAEGIASPRMLLRMAYIAEQLEQTPEALYYLNLHYGQTHSRETLLKMEELAEAHQLPGYNYTDTDYFYSLFRRNELFILLGVALIGFLVLGLFWRRKMQGRAYRTGAAFGLFAFLLLFIGYWAIRPRAYGVIRTEGRLLMQGPSAGSAPLKPLSQGQRLRVVGEEDVWLRVEDKSQKGYLRKQGVWVIP
jgi:hypothetical protein